MLHGSMLGPPAPWQREACASQCFGDEPFPRIREGKFGWDEEGYPYFVQLLGPSAWCHIPTSIPVFFYLETARCGGGGLSISMGMCRFSREKEIAQGWICWGGHIQDNCVS